MPNLINDLKSQHKEIILILEDCKNNISNKEYVLNKLKDAKYLIIFHLTLEDKELYPFLNEKSKENPNLKSYLTTFANEMDVITKNVIDFFEKYSTSITNEFNNDLAEISFSLKNRIGKEERVLYKEYEKLTKTKVDFI